MADKKISDLDHTAGLTADTKIEVETPTSESPDNGQSFSEWASLSEIKDWLGARVQLTGALDLYLDTTGNDSNDGSVSSPFLTFQGAWDRCRLHYDTAGYDITVHVGPGQYTGALVASGYLVGGGRLIFQGSTSPAADTELFVSGDAATAQFGARIGFRSMRVRGTGSCMYALQHGEITVFNDVEFGQATYHMRANYGGSITATGAHYDIQGNATIHAAAQNQGNVNLNSVVANIHASVIFSVFAYASFALLEAAAAVFNGATGVTGTRYQVLLNGVMQTGSGGANFFPGNAAGSANTGGQYL